MIQWEYNGLLMSAFGGDNVDILTSLGKDGWELVTINNRIAYMKRRIISGCKADNKRLEYENKILLDVVDNVRKAIHQRGGEVAAQEVCTIIYDHDHTTFNPKS